MNLKLNDKNTTIFIAIVILISLVIVCHLSNYLYSKEKFFDKWVYSQPINTLYSSINYFSLPKDICDNDVTNANIPCPTISCISTKYKQTLTPEQQRILYQYLYERSGLEIMKRVLSSETIV